MKIIFNNIKFHYTYLIVALSFILTGYFSNLIIFTSIILIHELGHYTIAKINKLKVTKIIIYPYGGITYLDIKLNESISKEFYVAISGILFQILYFFLITFLYKHYLIREYIYNIFLSYHNSILFFNILPIYPLDGSKILNLLLYKIFPYKLSNKITLIISFLVGVYLLLTNYYNFNYTTILISTIIINNLIKYYKNINYLFNKLLLERYIYKIKYKKIKKISTLDNIYKEKYHLIKENNQYITEKNALTHRFKGKY